MRKTSNINEFINKADKKHNFKYDYSKFVYLNSKIKGEIICSKHGSFWQNPGSHVHGQGCPLCAVEKKANLNRSNKDEFVSRANIIHNNKYDYSNLEYKDSRIKFLIICPIHGNFLQSPTQHLSGRGCPKCGRERIIKSHEYDTAEFIKRSNILHDSKYDYCKVNYVNSVSEIVVTCPIHGDFTQIAGNHLRGWGCEKCGLDEFINRNRWGRKPFIFPDGRVEKVQGFEPWTLNLLLSSSISPNSIVLSGKERPVVNYEWEGKTRRYFPDCYLSQTNTLVETKSDWTWKKDLNKNLAKISGSLESNYNIRVVIWDGHHKLISDTTYKA